MVVPNDVGAIMRHRGDGNCGCGQPHGPVADPTGALDSVLDATLLHRLFPQAPLRRRLLRSVGGATLLAALADLLPVGTLRALAQDRPAPEKPRVAAGFLPLTCAAPLIVGRERGFYRKHGIDLDLQKIAGVALIRDRMLAGELDVSQQVMPVALATTVGQGGVVVPTKVLTVLNQNGNSLVLAMKHRDNRDPRQWRGMRFAVPFEASHQALQLRAYLAAHGVDPDRDVAFRVTPPSEYVSQLRVGSIDGFFGGEPGGQRAVFEGAGFIHLLSKEIWDGHPCCSLTATDAWIRRHPATFLAVFRGALEAGMHCADPANRPGMAALMAQPAYLNAPETVVNQVLTGRYADGLGQVRNVPDRVTYDPFPDYGMAVWLAVQMRRWNLLPEDRDWKALARDVMLATDARRLLGEAGVVHAEPSFGTLRIMDRDFNTDDPEGELRALRPS